jgi:uncharacterized membrane protein HdeD (DUF308 family)
MAKTICKILGIVFILVGLLGFVMPNVLGMHLSPTHNIIHLVSGAAALYFGYAATYSAARSFCLIFGAVYLLLGIIGFVSPGIVASLVQAHETPGVTRDLTPDNLVHLLLGVVFLAGGLVRSTTTTPVHTS